MCYFILQCSGHHAIEAEWFCCEGGLAWQWWPSCSTLHNQITSGVCKIVMPRLLPVQKKVLEYISKALNIAQFRCYIVTFRKLVCKAKGANIEQRNVTYIHTYFSALGGNIFYHPKSVFPILKPCNRKPKRLRSRS